MSRDERRRRRQRQVLHDKPLAVSRRVFLAGGALLLAAAGLLGKLHFRRESGVSVEGATVPIRPPTASANDVAFRQACVRCGLCGTVCENGCIRFFGADETEHGAFTPHLDLRRRSCTLCMRCTEICPSGALRTVADDPEEIVKHVKIGRAVVDPEHCLSYLGRLCGYCHDACPIPEQAIRLTPPALPVVLDGCVGCGRCVEQCPQRPTAIRVERRTVT
jgi:ferredoxin